MDLETKAKVESQPCGNKIVKFSVPKVITRLLQFQLQSRYKAVTICYNLETTFFLYGKPLIQTCN